MADAVRPASTAFYSQSCFSGSYISSDVIDVHCWQLLIKLVSRGWLNDAGNYSSCQVTASVTILMRIQQPQHMCTQADAKCEPRTNDGLSSTLAFALFGRLSSVYRTLSRDIISHVYFVAISSWPTVIDC